MRAQRSIGGIEESTSKRTVDLTFLAPRPALSRIPIDKALGSVAIHGMRKNGHRVGVPSSISPRPTDYYWVYIHREREGERGRDGRERERSFPWFTLAGWNDAPLPAILVQNRFQCVVPTVRLSNAAAALVEPSISCPRGDRYPLRS